VSSTEGSTPWHVLLRQRIYCRTKDICSGSPIIYNSIILYAIEAPVPIWCCVIMAGIHLSFPMADCSIFGIAKGTLGGHISALRCHRECESISSTTKVLMGGLAQTRTEPKRTPENAREGLDRTQGSSENEETTLYTAARAMSSVWQ
jgi:hypothetical protein